MRRLKKGQRFEYRPVFGTLPYRASIFEVIDVLPRGFYRVTVIQYPPDPEFEGATWEMRPENFRVIPLDSEGRARG